MGEAFHLAAVHQELAGTFRVVIEPVRLGIFGNVAADQPDFIVLDARVGFFQRHVAIAQALDLAADQDDAAFERVEYGVVVSGLAVVRDDLVVGRGGVGGLFLGL
jgi:hypothetical protein